MDYSRYTLAELNESLASIDKEAFPENYQKLLAELENRKDEVEHYTAEQEQKQLFRVETRLNILSILQLSTMLGFLYLAYSSYSNLGVSFTSALVLLIAIFNGVAGWLLHKRRKLGFRLSFINQAAQLIALNVGFFYYSYSGLGTLMVILQDGIELQAYLLNPSVRVLFGEDLGLGIGIDLLALAFISLLNTCRDETNHWQD